MNKKITFTQEKKTMNEVDKVTRETKSLVDSIRDTLAANILSATKNKTITLTEGQLQNIISIANLSVDEGYQKAIPHFQRSLKNKLSEVAQKKSK